MLRLQTISFRATRAAAVCLFASLLASCGDGGGTAEDPNSASVATSMTFNSASGVSQCCDGQSQTCWFERGETCHSDPRFRSTFGVTTQIDPADTSNNVRVDQLSAVKIHMCPMHHEGNSYVAIPVRELAAIVVELGKEHALPLAMDQTAALIVQPITEGCTADDGVNVPGVPPDDWTKGLDLPRGPPTNTPLDDGKE